MNRAAMAAENALELSRIGYFTTPEHAPYKIAQQGRIARLRRYGGDDYQPSVPAPIVLVPPLMVTAEIYDVAPDISAVRSLLGAGLDVWVVDFGSPEQEEGGLERTLEDHVHAVSQAIDFIGRATGQKVHLAGYSQGGMFAYQTAAYRRTEGIRSVITFGSPVDIHRNFPKVDESVAARAFEAANALLEAPLEKVEALPGFLTSTGFKLLSFRKEVGQVWDFLQKLHDRHALEKREARRRFLGGEGFVAWPGPALRQFIDEFVVHNRMLSGGFVVHGRSLTLADIGCPILFFVGERDAFANPAAVRAIVGAAANADAFEVSMRAGHFGLVVGGQAMSSTWPTVASWIRWQEGLGPKPAALERAARPEEPEEASFESVDFDLELFYDAIARSFGELWSRAGDAVTSLGQRIDDLRFQLPRLKILQELGPESRVSLGLELARRAEQNPGGTLFLWKGRAFSYAQADRRVDNVVRGLVHCGIEPGQRVAVLMKPRPSYLSVTVALSRLGAVPVLFGPNHPISTLRRAIDSLGLRTVVTDPEGAASCEGLFDRVLVLGGARGAASLPRGVVSMEAIDPSTVTLPEGYEANPGRGADLAMIMLTAGRTAEPRLARISNHRWAFSAYGTAATCGLSSKDTVYCGLPLHHPAGMLVALAGGLVGGSRLALADGFHADTFWEEVRRYGATVVFYAGDMLRALLDAPPSATDNLNPVRLFAGSGLRRDVWARVLERFGPVAILEFYASTEGLAVLANASGEKLGALGRPLPGSAEVRLARYDFERGELVRSAQGRLVECDDEEPGILVARSDAKHPVVPLQAGEEARQGRLLHGAFDEDDSWFLAQDVLRRDSDGDYWFVDRLGRMLRTEHGLVASRRIEDALYGYGPIRQAVVYGVAASGFDVPVAVLATEADAPLDPDAFGEFARRLPRIERPRYIRQLASIPLTDGFRPDKAKLQTLRVPSGPGVFVWDESQQSYLPGTEASEAEGA